MLPITPMLPMGALRCRPQTTAALDAKSAKMLAEIKHALSKTEGGVLG